MQQRAARKANPIFGSRLRVVALACVVAATAVAILAASASAIVIQRPGPDASYQPLNGAAPPSGAQPFSLLSYHGGPVMRSNTEYAMFWGGGFPTGYKAAVTKYLKDVAADTGKSTNVYSVGTQYTDSNGHRAAYDTTYGGSFTDTNPYPANGCPAYNGLGGQHFAKCLSDAQLSSEVNSFVSAHSLPRGLTNEYFVVLPPATGNCFDSGGSQCFDTVYCAYHSFNNTGGTTLYANISDGAVDPGGCGVGEYPNGHANGNVDDSLSGLSHEANETITDPRLDAWWDSSTGQENGDKCRNTADDYGPPLGGTAGHLFNQLIHADHYYLQMEWGNAINGCEQRNVLPVASFTAPGTGKTGTAVHFNGSASHDDDGSLIKRAWTFGDGGTSGAVSPSHTYTTTGRFAVKLTVTDNNGFTASKTRHIRITAP